MKSILAPLKALSFLGREPVTLPIAPRPAAPNYRGFHINDWEKCIGCGTCATICDNYAIRMVDIKDLSSDPIKGIKPRRPAIDYGRCCWCALCVDVCPTGSLALSREYVHIGLDLNTFFILPDEKGMHGLGFPKGWAKSSDSDLLDLKRQPIPELTAKERQDSFVEIVQGFDDQTALLEASRCIQCGMCHDACPTHMHAPEYIRAIWAGELEEAVQQIYRTNPLANVCGRVCTHRCETACSIGVRGKAISIRWLKRYAMDKVSHERIKQIASKGRNTIESGKKVAIVGAGPAGLTAAYDLARQGHAVTIFEALEKPGGMMRYGIPEYRLPYDKIDEDIDVIESMGVDIRCNVHIGHQMASLENDFDATLIAIGLHGGRSTRVPGTDHPHVYSAIDLLRRLTLKEKIEVKKKIVVIGGGNVAFDIARSLARLQRNLFGEVKVVITALEDRENLLASPVEVKEANEEELQLFTSRGPRRCVVKDGTLMGLETVRCISIFDEQGRFHPKYDDSDLIFHEADMVVEAIGQAPQLDFLGDELTERLEWDKRGRPVINQGGCTSEPWLWAAGDVVEGPDVIHAIAAGHRVANSIHQYLSIK
ncbi:oxidoreductase [Candidatus Thiomargarita nelsonii]|uniref:Oxidoreductase n=1 Tax=Candidatus Thiomargarita nelsonii TaxID=1003181 RepID=A0A0A6PDV5_9GAMM|nr:oxidoreductase [Candidatus Thiomargarita nelsonii]